MSTMLRCQGIKPSMGHTLHTRPRIQSRPRLTRNFRPQSVATPESKQTSKTSTKSSSKSRSSASLELSSQSDSNSSSSSSSSESFDLVFIDENGERIKVMPADYGFRSGAGRLYQDGYGSVPTSAVGLAVDNFRKELLSLRRSVRFDEYRTISESVEGAGILRRLSFVLGGKVRSALARLDEWLEGKDVLRELRLPRDAVDPDLTPEQVDILERVRALHLDDALVAARERRREASGDQVTAPWPIHFAYSSLCWVLDVIYEGRPIQRFWFLETVARMPYFAFISMLHLYESLGWWRAGAELRKVHFAEEWNELHHLQIMESLGGDQLWIDRFMAEHAAVFYYWVLVVMYLVSPSASYTFCVLVENHAADTYAEFAEQNAEGLRNIPPPLVALNYYKSGDLYLFDQLQTGWPAQEPRRPPCSSLYDVFINIRDDELEHSKTMVACKDNTMVLGPPAGGSAQVVAQQVRVLATFDTDDEEDEGYRSS